MTPKQKMLVQATFEKIAPIADNAAALFYRRLFMLDPALSKLFKGDMKEQGRKLMRIIGMAVNGLDRFNDLVPLVQDLGIRHVKYGVSPVDYDTVGAALLWTLEQGLGPDFTPEVKEAWATVYGLLAKTMVEAAYPVPAPMRAVTQV